MKGRPKMPCQSRPCDFYVGPSMHPTLKPLDRLNLIDYGARTVRSGDVIVFRSPMDGQRLTHRVTKSNAEGIMTRGDNNDRRDPWVLTPEEVQGQVVSARRNGRWVTIHGGLRGRIRAAEIRFMRHVIRMIYRPLRTMYRALTGNGRFRLKLPIRKIFRIISFQRQERTEFQLLIGSKVVAGQADEQGHWLLRRPYSWFLSEKCLPAPPFGSDKEGQPNRYI